MVPLVTELSDHNAKKLTVDNIITKIPPHYKLIKLLDYYQYQIKILKILDNKFLEKKRRDGEN